MTLTVIDEQGDLTVEIIEKSDRTFSADGEPITLKTGQFKVNKAILTKASQTLLRMLAGPQWQESSQTLVSLGEGHVNVTEIWLKVIHNAKLEYTLPFPELWHLVQAIDYYELDLTEFKNFFATWYQRTNIILLKPRELLFPTWRFDHAKGFANWTKCLAYGMTGHITEGNPTDLYNYRLPSRLIRTLNRLSFKHQHTDSSTEQLNAAKGRLRTVLHRGLFKPCDHLFGATCRCRKVTLYDYQKHLYDIGVWPLETIFLKTSMGEILDNLQRFSYEAAPGACSSCKQNYNAIVAGVESQVRTYFDGLCLDCLDRSKPKLGDTDRDYWRHHKLSEDEWTSGCRFPHKQPTWYFSFNGRKEDRDRLAKEAASSKRDTRHRFHGHPDIEDEDDEFAWLAECMRSMGTRPS